VAQDGLLFATGRLQAKQRKRILINKRRVGVVRFMWVFSEEVFDKLVFDKLNGDSDQVVKTLYFSPRSAATA
jgi:hypothetical protein